MKFSIDNDAHEREIATALGHQVPKPSSGFPSYLSFCQADHSDICISSWTGVCALKEIVIRDVARL